ncbi:MAG: hypothetical protein QM734_12450 [Cyclobacteriaceae bacterium]
MKKFIVILIFLQLTSCKKDEVISDSALYHDWKWVSTLYSEPIAGVFLIPHYYDFQKNGTIQMIDTSSVVMYQWQFSLAKNQQLFINGGNFKQSYTYTIKNDTLKLVGNLEEIDAQTNQILNSNPVTHLFKIQN